jgi:glycosyltransferase involved in cell wall biosynthesis
VEPLLGRHPADAAALAAAGAELALAPALRAEMGARARRRAETELTWDAVARRYRAAYLAALNRS